MLLQLVWTWADYYTETRSVAKAFIKLGMPRYSSVCILGFNSPEWILANVAAIFAGGFATGIYPTNGPEACRYILEHSRCSVLVVEDQKQLDKVLAFRNDLPDLKKIVQYTGTPSSPGVISWKVNIIICQMFAKNILTNWRFISTTSLKYSLTNVDCVRRT